MSGTGKILILELYDKMLSMLIQDNQILSIHAQKEDVPAIGNVYVGRVQNISRNIGAVFVDIGGGCLTFLPAAEAKDAVVTNRMTDKSVEKSDRPLKIGDEVLVQVVKEPMKTKLAGVTTKISLAGNYVVVGMKETDDVVQVSSKLNRKQQNRFRNLEALQELAGQCRIIVRTNAGELQDDAPLIEEARALCERLETILNTACTRTCYSCLYHSKPDYISFVQNAYRTEFDEVITDLPSVFERLQETFRESDLSVRFYEDERLPLYKLYSVEIRIKELLDKRVWLKSGGYLVIEPTEALISIDVNTGKCESGKDKEETFLKINMEAARMIACQLRARNLSGMILVDFINLREKEHETQLVEYMRNLLKKDAVKTNVVDMTGLGLMEITRKKVSPSFAEQMKD